LDNELNAYLAEEHGVTPERFKDKNGKVVQSNFEVAYQAWKQRHEPFHWFVEFYDIMATGGFDVMIGNPPYVEYRQVANTYNIGHYHTLGCGNLYAYVIERCHALSNDKSRIGMIVQLPIVCTDRMIPLQDLYTQRSRDTWYATFDDRPGRLFDGLEHIRATIAMNTVGSGPSRISTTKYNRWLTEAREPLFPTLAYTNVSNWKFTGAVPKLGSSEDVAISHKILRHKPLSDSIRGSKEIYFHNAPQYWVRAMTFKPYFWNERDGEKLSTQVKPISFPSEELAKAACAALNSTLFYWWFIVLSDCRHLNMREIDRFPIGLETIDKKTKSNLVMLCDELMKDFKKNKRRKDCVYKTTGRVSYDEYFPKFSKSCIDEIDRALAPHFGFTNEEIDYLINFDIKYRAGLDSDE